VMYAYPSYVAFGGQVGIDLDKGNLIVDGDLQGAMNFGLGQYDVEGLLEIHINEWPIPKFTAEADAVVSNVGLAACGLVQVGKATAAGGVGYTWNGQVVVMVGSCDLTPFRVIISATGARAAAAGRAVAVPEGRTNEMLEVDGRGGAPDLTVTGPGGLRVSSQGQDLVTQPHLIIARNAALNRTDVIILHPRPGRYRLITNRGSAPIARVLEAHGFTPQIHARVRGKGRLRHLVYHVNAQPGMRVEFVERGSGVDRLIGTTTKSNGTITFKPAPGPGGIRQIIAMANERDMPIALRPGSPDGGHLTVASYRAPGPRRLGRVHGLIAYRVHNRLTVSFDKAPGAKRYAVLVSLASGLRTQYEITATHLTVAVANLEAPFGGTVGVLPLGDGLRTTNGPLTRVKLALSKPKPHRHKAGKRKSK
jgi:hypothetical protein